MIVNIVCSGIESLIQMYICFGIFVEAYGKERKLNKWVKVGIGILLVAWCLTKTYNNMIYLFSFTMILIEFPVITILLWLIVMKEFTRIAAWCLFITANNVLLKLPTMVIMGLIYNQSLSDMSVLYNSQTWSRVVNCVIFIILLIIITKEKEFIARHFKNLSHQRAVLLFIGAIECIIILYVMYLGLYGFTIQTFILSMCLIFMLFMLIVCLLVVLEYQIMARLNRLLKSKENSMKTNYALINQEINRNRKINHDNKHDMEYLYHCFEQRDYERGLEYIRQKNNHYNLLQKNSIWTGYGSIDFLINRAKAQADEKKILFTIEVDIVEIPIEEYDFFSVLSNLLDNAIEASMQNKEGEGRITLKILSQNNVFRLKIKNTYLTEPNKKGKRFISSKEDSELHGWGIENVREIVDRYEGQLDISYGYGIFLVVLILIQ